MTAGRLAPFVLFVIAGCTSTPRMPEVSASHPASPSGPEARIEPRPGTLAVAGGHVGAASRSASAWPSSPALPAFGCFPDDGSISDGVRAILAEPLTEENAVRVAVLNNRAVRALYEELGIARADLVQAGLLRNPVFEGDAKFFGGGVTEIELAITHAFVDAFAIPLRRRVAAARFCEVKASVSRRMVHVAFEVRRAFVEYRAHAAVRDLRKHELDVATGSLDLMRQLHDAGNATALQLAVVEEPAAHARLELAAAEAAAAESREPINVLLGLWGDAAAWTPAPAALEEAGAIPAEHSHCEARAVAASFDLAEARAHAEGAARRAGLSSWDAYLSETELGVAAKKEGADGWGLGPAARVEIPVFDSGCARAAGAAADLRRDLANYASLAVEVRSAARRLRDRVAALEERASFMKAVHMPVQDKLLRETLKSFNAMQIGAFEVLLARGRQLDGMREHVDTLRDLALARLDLAELLAGSLDRARVNQDEHSMSEAAPAAPGHGMGGHR